MSQPKILMYVTAWCPYCRRARSFFEEQGLLFEEIDIEKQPTARDEMTARSASSSVPQIFIGERHVGGCDDLLALAASGGLDPLLNRSSP